MPDTDDDAFDDNEKVEVAIPILSSPKGLPLPLDIVVVVGGSAGSAGASANGLPAVLPAPCGVGGRAVNDDDDDVAGTTDAAAAAARGAILAAGTPAPARRTGATPTVGGASALDNAARITRLAQKYYFFVLRRSQTLLEQATCRTAQHIPSV